MKITITAIIKGQSARYYMKKSIHYAKSKTICNTFFNTKFDTFALRDFSLNF